MADPSVPSASKVTWNTGGGRLPGNASAGVIGCDRDERPELGVLFMPALSQWRDSATPSRSGLLSALSRSCVDEAVSERPGSSLE